MDQLRCCLRYYGYRHTIEEGRLASGTSVSVTAGNQCRAIRTVAMCQSREDGFFGFVRLVERCETDKELACTNFG